MTSTEYVGLGPCVQDPAWVKMNSPTLQKRKKKQEAKPQSHINKCLNEKRRRDQENTYFEELAELIQASLVADMNKLSAKPDKCVILQQTVDKINQIKEAEASEEAVQQGEVTSSRQTLLQNKLVCPLVLQALDGFLFLVSTEGKIELVSENVSQYIKFTPDDLVGKNIFNFIDVGDHTKFSSSFMSVGWPRKASNESSRSRSFTCRLLVKPPDDQEETMEEKQQRVSYYEPMQISAALHSNYLGERGEPEESSEGDNQPYLLCIARRIPANEPQSNSIEQFTTKLDVLGTILDIDISGVSEAYSQYLTKDLVKQNFGDLCFPSDLSSFTKLIQETRLSGHSTSQVYKLKFGSNYIHIQTKCKYFQNLQEESFIMATHTIISTFQDGSGTSTNSSGSSSGSNLLEDTLGNALARVTEDEVGSKNSGDKHSLMLTSQGNEGNTDLRRNLEEITSMEGQQQSNKILKSLLNQNDEDEPSLQTSTNIFGRSIPHMQNTPSPQQQVSHHMNHFHETSANNSSSGTSAGNNMLRNLLNDNEHTEGEEVKIKAETDDFLLGFLSDSKEDKFNIKQEFHPSTTSASPVGSSYSYMGMSPSTPPSSSSGVLTSMSATPFSFPTASPLSFSRPASVELSNEADGSGMRGIKRPNEAPHDGNPSKQSVGGFESLLVPSPPTSTKSPVSIPVGGPPTPIASPNTPTSRSNTPIGRSNTPIGRANTPVGKPNPGHPGSMNPQMRPSTPYILSRPSMGMGHMQDDGLGQQQMAMGVHQGNVSQNHPNMQSSSQYTPSLASVLQSKPQQNPQAQQDEANKNNKLLRELLSHQPSKCLPLSVEMPSPYGLPREKLPKDIAEKIPARVANAPAPTAPPPPPTPPVSSPPTEILSTILNQPRGSRTTSRTKNTGASGPFIQQTSQQYPNFLMGENRQQLLGQLQPSQHPAIQRQNSQNANSNFNSCGPSSNMDSLPSPLSNSDPSRMSMASIPSGTSVAYSSPSTTTTTLPPFVPPSGINPLSIVPSGSYSDGHLPSITAATLCSSQEPMGNDLHDMVIQAILDMETSSVSSDSGLGAILGEYQVPSSSSPYDRDEKDAIQQIQDKLMSELETQNAPVVTLSMGMSSYAGTSTMTSANAYPPPYGQRARFSNQVPSAAVNKSSVASNHGGGGGPNMQNRSLHPGHQQRLSQLSVTQQEPMRPRLQRHQSQVLLPTSTSDVPQASPSSYNQNFDDIINSPGPNVNMLQRNATEPQSSPNYGLLHSPIGNSAGEQVSPGQRIPQPAFSPHGQIPSPLSNTQQFSNSSGIVQMAGYQNSQNSQHSPRLSQSSPAPPSYSSGGALMPQISPTGQISPSQQNPAWSSTNQQQRSNLQQPNSMLTSQLSMMSGGSRNFSSASRSSAMLPSMRSLPSPGARPYPVAGSHPTGSGDVNAFPPSSSQQGPQPQQIMYAQQQTTQQAPYRLQRTMSTPVQMPVAAGHTGMLSNQTRRQLLARVGSNTCSSEGSGPSSPSLAPQQMPQRVPQHAQQQQTQPRPQTTQNTSTFQPSLDHQHSLDQSLLHTLGPNGGGNWGRDTVSGTSLSTTGGMAPSPRVDDGRASGSASENDRSSMLKKLLEE